MLGGAFKIWPLIKRIQSSGFENINSVERLKITGCTDSHKSWLIQTLHQVSLNFYEVSYYDPFTPYLICTRFLENQVWKGKLDELDFLSISNLIFSACVTCKYNFIQLRFSKSIFQKGVRFIKCPTELIGNEVHESAANFHFWHYADLPNLKLKSGTVSKRCSSTVVCALVEWEIGQFFCTHFLASFTKSRTL